MNRDTQKICSPTHHNSTFEIVAYFFKSRRNDEKILKDFYNTLT